MRGSLQDIVHWVDIHAPRSTVWDVMTGRESAPQWLGCLNYEMRMGATFHMQPDAARRARADLSGATQCDVEELRKPELFRFSWYLPGTPKTLVMIELADRGSDVTRATLTHSGWGQFPLEMGRPFHAMLDSAWEASVLPNLKASAEAFRKAIS